MAYGVRLDMDSETCANACNLLCSLLNRYHGTPPVVLMDEYDTPMQEAWTHGYWDEAASFMRDLMNSTFKTNASLGRGLITGITRISKESIFSDLNNLSVVATSSKLYRDSFGFTESELISSLAEYGLSHELHGVRAWYDGFTFGGTDSIYNPYSIVGFLDSGGTYRNYWANSSSNELVSEVVRAGGHDLKSDFESLLAGETLKKAIKEEVVFSQLRSDPDAVWALLLATGYVTARGDVPKVLEGAERELALTNHEVLIAMRDMVETWFSGARWDFDAFTKAILKGDNREATKYLREVTETCVSSFDVGTRPSKRSEPERFYHGLVLGLLVSLRNTHVVESNRESGYGRYDVALIPKDVTRADPALIIEFKVFDGDAEETLADTVQRAHDQIEAKGYVTGIIERGIPAERIRTLGIAFRGKEVLVG